MNNNKSTKEEPVFPAGSYAEFHFKFKGKHFLTSSGEILTKLDVWNEHKNTDMIRMILNGTARQYQAVDKDGWRDGKLV